MSANAGPPAREVRRLRGVKAAATQRLDEAAATWRGTDADFRTQLAAERGAAEDLMVRKLAAFLCGEGPWSDALHFPRLLHEEVLRVTRLAGPQALIRVRDFFATQEYHRIGWVDLEARLWAANTLRIGGGRPAHVSDLADLSMISHLAAHCDLMLLDRSMADLVRQPRVEFARLSGGTRVYSCRTLPEFVAELASIDS